MNGKKIFVDYNSPVATGEKMNINVRISNELGFVKDAKVLFNKHGEKPGTDQCKYLMYDEKKSCADFSCFTGEVIFSTPGYRSFYIQLNLNGKVKQIKYDSYEDNAVISEGKEFWETFVYYPMFDIPKWVKGGIMYQIFVDTFHRKDIPEHLKDKVVDWNTEVKWKPDADGEYRNNQFYGGNLKGIIEKLPYIKSLGVTVIYLTPIFKSTSSNRYNIDNYDEIDELVGTWDDLDELHRKANEMGMYLILDVVFNHSGINNPLLKEHPEIYEWIENGETLKTWWGYKELPELNKYSEEYYIQMTPRFKKWSKHSDGTRVDVADNMPVHTLVYYKSVSEKYVLLEYWKNAVTSEYNGVLYGNAGDGLMNYQFTNAIYRRIRFGNWRHFRQSVKQICRLYPSDFLDACPIFLSSHDIPRIPNILVGDFMKEDPSFENVWDMEKNGYWYDENGKFDTYKFRKWEFEHDKIPTELEELAEKLHKKAVFYQYTLPGLPAIFAGDEVGTTGFKDPHNRKAFPWDNIKMSLYNFYCDMGTFRIKYKDIFSDSRNYKIISSDDDKDVYRRKDLIFIVNHKDEELLLEKEYQNRELIFSYETLSSKNVVPPHGAIVIR